MKLRLFSTSPPYRGLPARSPSGLIGRSTEGGLLSLVNRQFIEDRGLACCILSLNVALDSAFEVWELRHPDRKLCRGYSGDSKPPAQSAVVLEYVLAGGGLYRLRRASAYRTCPV